MNYNRLIRDVGILILFCAGFFLCTQAINLLGEERVEPVQIEFSEARRMADRHVIRKDYKAAIGFLTKLTDEDEFNSHAWFRLGLCYSSLYSLSKKPSIADPAPYTEDSRAYQKELADNAVEALMHVIDYPRYRIPAMQRIASIHVQEGNNEAALDMLEKATEFETEIQNPHFIRRDPFLALADEPRYKKINAALWRNAPNYHRQRRSNRRGIGVAGRRGSETTKPASNK